MLDFIKENKTFAGIIIAIIVLVGGYFAYNSGSSNELLTSTGVESPTAQVSKELLATLSNLKSLSLDTSVFTDPVFISLVDFGSVIPLEPTGRDNPFAPLNGLGVRNAASISGAEVKNVTVGSKSSTKPAGK